MCDTLEDAYEMADLVSEVVSCKKAAIVVVFFLYILYALTTGGIYFMEYKKNDEAVKKLKAIKLDLEQRQFFILAMALLIQVITPVPFPVVMLYLYLILVGLMVVGHLKQEKWLLYLIAIAGQLLFAFILIFFVLINPWCRHYYFRYIVGEPPSSYYQVPAESNSGNNGTIPNYPIDDDASNTGNE